MSEARWQDYTITLILMNLLMALVCLPRKTRTHEQASKALPLLGAEEKNILKKTNERNAHKEV